MQGNIRDKRVKEIFGNAGKPAIESTASLIKVLHEGQKDEVGKPYYKHPMRVANNVRRLSPGADNDTVMAALLHDVIEDCNVTTDDLRNWGYSEDCISAVLTVTDRPEDDVGTESSNNLDPAVKYDRKIDRLISSGDKRGMLVKLSDNADNLHPERVESYMQYNREEAILWGNCYRASVTKLCKALDLDEKRVFELIKNSPPIGTSLPLYDGLDI